MMIKHILVMWSFVMMVQGTENGGGEWTADSGEHMSTVEVAAVLGRTATLPCNITPDLKEDRVYMVLWFREGGSKPIYSFDARGRSLPKAREWSDPGTFGPRATFNSVDRPATLTLSSVQLDDEGTYRCRVDFKNSPTRHFLIKLDVIVPPHQIMMYDNSGADASGTVGPIEEGATLVLICEVRGGRPEPTISWLINGLPAPQFVGSKTDTHVVINRLKLQAVRREDFNTTFTCKASNTNTVAPLQKTVRLEMNLSPLSVNFENKPKQFVANAAATVRCIAEGSRPPAKITWYKNEKIINSNKISQKSNGTQTISTLILVPSTKDHDSVIKCLAYNPALPIKSKEDYLRLNVVYSPIVTLKLGSKLKENYIKEDSDVYFECDVQANPKEYRISWFHENRPVTNQQKSGPLVIGKALAIQKVTKNDRGAYTCKAANVRGETTSQVVNLRVKYAPVCAESALQIVGAALEEELRVRCSVQADPSDVTFVWQFNNSGESFDVPAHKFSPVNSSVSELRYRPLSDRDYGALSCRGINSVGRQEQPCVFQVVPAARPSPPKNCSISSGNLTESFESLTVDDIGEFLTINCVAGYDGGLPQTIILEARDARSNNLRFNKTSKDIDGIALFLLPASSLWSGGASLQLSVYSENDKGASSRIILNALSYQDPEPRTDGTSLAGLSKTTMWLILIMATLCACAIVTVTFLLRRKKPERYIKKPELQVNASNGQYVVAYTLKPSKYVKPDILNPPQDGDVSFPKKELTLHGDGDILQLNSVDSSQAGASTTQTNPSSLCSNKILDDTTKLASPSKLHQPITTGKLRRGKLIPEELPGPESCV